MQHRLYCEIVKIETPEASVSGVFNLRRFFSGRRPLAISQFEAALKGHERGTHWVACRKSRKMEEALASEGRHLAR